MKNILTLLAVTASLSLYAQQQKGDLSLQFSGNYFSQTIRYSNYKFKFGAGNVGFKIGKFFTDNLELGVKPNLTFLIITEPPVTTGSDQKEAKTTFNSNVGFGLYGAYSFITPSGKLLPYCGAEINYTPSGEEATINLGPYLGAKYFLTERVNIDANLSWLINLGSSYEEAKGFYDISPQWNVNIGVGVLLGKLND
jgi:outer membrane protein W